MDGISNPKVLGFDTDTNPGPKPVQAGVILTGQPGDPGFSIRKDWSTDGSFAVFRYLFQKVPEFNDFLTKNPLSKDGRGNDLTPKEGSELLGARIVGRWKGGAPIDISPFQDDPALGADPKRYINIVLCKHPGETDRFDLLNRNNDFAYVNERASPLRCPYAAHVRKTNPRDDLEVLPPGIKIPFTVESRRIMRRGVQFGPELTKAEQESGKTMHGRGLLFTCYQSSITNGFQFIQQCQSLFFDCFSWS